MDDPDISQRVAVIAVHGVADQQRGDTVESVAALLASQCAGSTQRQDRLLSVARVYACEKHDSMPEGNVSERFRKSRKQSLRSDFVDDMKKRFTGEQEKRTATRFDLGTLYTDYLLSKANDRTAPADGDRPDAHTQVATVHVRAPGVAADLFEMYWADLSRVQSGFVRVLSELATLLFRFARLGTEAQNVGAALAPTLALTWLAATQRYAEWFLSRLLAPAALQILLCVVLFASARSVEKSPQAALWASAIVTGFSAACVLVYRGDQRWVTSVGLGLLAGLALPVIAMRVDPVIASMAVVFIGLSAVYWLLAKYWENRFRAAFVTSLALYATTWVSLLVCLAIRQASTDHRFSNAVLSASEIALLINYVLWIAEWVLLIATTLLFPVTWWTCRNDKQQVRRVMITARLALFTAVGAFLAASMLCAGIINKSRSGDVEGVTYNPMFLCPHERAQPGSEGPHLSCASTTGKALSHVEPTAADFFKVQNKVAGAAFPGVALVLLALLGFAVVSFAPSVLLELRILERFKRVRLGVWLTRGYAALEWMVLGWGLVVPVVGLWTVNLLVRHSTARWFTLTPPPWLRAVDHYMENTAGTWLSGAVALVAVNGVGLIALGKVTVSNIKALRAPLDAALDVDNHFREFPRRAISRVQIIERYLALLDHLRQQGYRRVVLVAHSQGTVITADLLRYLRRRGVDDSRLGQVQRWLSTTDISLLTVGSPLRQLYALRFPRTYDWVVQELVGQDGTSMGPNPSDLGVKRWWNLWASGDYVGRWLWTAEGKEAEPFSIVEKRYAGELRTGCDITGATWVDLCIGADAHTHYFDLDQRIVAERLRGLVQTATDSKNLPVTGESGKPEPPLKDAAQ